MRIDTSEANILKLLMLKLSKNKVSIFRNNVGTGWVGRVRRVIKPGTISTEHGYETIKPGDIVISEPRPLNAGLCKGSSDLIGWRSIEITSNMVGKRIAVFTAVEGKKHNGRISAEQTIFIQNIRNAGGIAGVARTEDEAEGLVNKFLSDIQL